MKSFIKSLVRGIEAQSKSNVNKAQFVESYLAENNVEFITDLTHEKIVALNVAISKVDAQPAIDIRMNLTGVFDNNNFTKD